MLDFGDEIVLLDSYKVPWLIWIQILVLFLLILLLLGFSLSATSSDLASPASAAEASTSSGGSSRFDHPSKNRVSSSCNYSQVGDNRSIKGEVPTSTGRRIVVEDDPERDRAGAAAAAKDANHMDLHPCNYFRMAKHAFLKCLGLECLYERSSSLERKKER